MCRGRAQVHRGTEETCQVRASIFSLQIETKAENFLKAKGLEEARVKIPMDLDKCHTLHLRRRSVRDQQLALPDRVNSGSLSRGTQDLLVSLGRMALQDCVDSLGTEGSPAQW